MDSSANPASLKSTSVHPAAYFLVASGGGVVGTDYAQWLAVDPVIGAIVGGIVSLVILRVAAYLCDDPGGHIRKTFSEVGAFVGVVLGAYIANGNSDEGFAWLVGGVVGGIIGWHTGQAASAIVAFLGFAVLFLSQGPVGLAVRTFIMNLN